MLHISPKVLLSFCFLTLLFKVLGFFSFCKYTVIAAVHNVAAIPSSALVVTQVYNGLFKTKMIIIYYFHAKNQLSK